MIVREKILDNLKSLSSSQFEELLFRLFGDIDVSHLSGPEASQVKRSIDLICQLEQNEFGLEKLQRLLSNLYLFKKFLPEGAYPVGHELLEGEESHEYEAMKEAAARGEDPEYYRVTPEKFYTFKPEAAWLGVFRGWDSIRGFHSELIGRVIGASQSRKNCPAAALIGPGGSGKSVAMRRLAVDLANQSYNVWWVEEPERLLRFGISQLVNTSDALHFLFIDDIQSLEDEYILRFQRILLNNPSLILVVAGRSLPVGFRARANLTDGLFVPDETSDRVSILEKISKTIPAWAEIAKQLAAESLRKARLIRILLVMARRKAAPRNLQELETTFLEILSDDLRRIRSAQFGLAEAIIDAAAIHQSGYDISRETLIKLADYHQPGAGIPILLEEIIGNPRWLSIAPLMLYNPEYKVVRFHHDELAEGLILAGQRRLLGQREVRRYLEEGYTRLGY